MYCPVYSTKLIRESSIRYPKQCNSSQAAARIVSELLDDSPQEQLCVVMLDTQLRPIGVHVCSTGTLDAALAHPRELFRPAILANASAIILAHNHPSGDVTPSPADLNVYKSAKESGKLLGITCHDSIIVGVDTDGNRQAYSMAEGSYYNG